jgi:hypothetical protein
MIEDVVDELFVTGDHGRELAAADDDIEERLALRLYGVCGPDEPPDERAESDW